MGVKDLAIRFFKESFPWEAILKQVFWLLAEIVDMVIKGEDLEFRQKKLVRTFYYIGKEWGEMWVRDTDNDLDDDSLEKLLGKAVDTADEGSFELPAIPDLE